MAWECTSCEEKTTIKDVTNFVFKIGVIGVLAYLVISNRQQIKELSEATTKKIKTKLSGTSRKKKRA